MATNELCPVCQEEQANVTNLQDESRFDCPRCGRYALHDDASLDCRNPHPGFNRAHASGWIREHQNTRITDSVIALFKALRAPTVNERARKLLLAMYRNHPYPGEQITVALASNHPEWLAITWSVTSSEIVFLLRSILGERGFVKVPPPPDVNNTISGCTITAQGHETIDSLGRVAVTSDIGFCAMWFEPKLDQVWFEAIQPAIELAGYVPKRIDKHEHLNKIDDEIIAMIRRSRFVVADLSGSRGGVYYEAGFASGLNIPVIYTVRSKRRHKVHFDTRQFVNIGWDLEDLATFRKDLKLKIEANLGHGPK